VAIHVTSDVEAQELARFRFALTRVVNVSNGIASPAAVPPAAAAISADVAPILRHERLVLFLGRINWKKGLDRLIPALTQAPNAHLAIVGNDEEGLLPGLKALVERHNLRDRVTFISRVVEGVDKQSLYSAAAVFVLPSYSENFGNTVIEALAAGCPALVTPEVGAAEIVRASGGGGVVAGDAEAFGRALRDLLDDPRRAEIGRCGRRYVAENLTWSAIAGRMERAYAELCARRGEGGVIAR
jgi:glycosyltransferase involved in cell wall biosynthesis